MINSATCNATDTAGCNGPIPAIPVGRAPLLVAADTTTDQIYVTNYASATVTIIDGSTCNATITTGCAQPAPAQTVGSQPFGLAVNDSTNIVHAFTQLGDGAISIFGGSP